MSINTTTTTAKAPTTGIVGFVADLRSPRTLSPSAPEAYFRLRDAMIALSDAPRFIDPLTRAWADRSFQNAFSRGLLLMAAWRFQALANPRHPLATEVLVDGEAPDLETRVLAAMADPDLEAILRDRTIQTNEPGRAVGWGLVALLLGFDNRGWSLCDMGASLGLNLVADLTPANFRMGPNKLSAMEFPTPHGRLGLDLAPMDPTDLVEMRWLQACIWPGQPDRHEAFLGALKVWQRPWRGKSPAPQVRAHRLGVDDTPGILDSLCADPAARTVVAFESIVSPYMDATTALSHRAQLRSWLKTGSDHARRLWVSMDLRPEDATGRIPQPPVSINVHMAADADRGAAGPATIQTFEVGRCGYHPTGCVILSKGCAELKQRWGTG